MTPTYSSADETSFSRRVFSPQPYTNITNIDMLVLKVAGDFITKIMQLCSFEIIQSECAQTY